MAGEGKKFERMFKDSATKQGILCVRFNDSDMSYNLNKELRSRFTAKNPADFFIYKYPYVFFLEMKSTKYKSMSFERDEYDSGMIHLTQIQSLSNLVLYEPVRAGFVFNFRNENDDEVYSEETFYMSIQNFNSFYCNTDKMSINKKDILSNGGFLIEARQRRKYYDYNVNMMLLEINEREGGAL